MNEYDMAEVQKQWYDRDGWPLDLNAVYAINEFKGDSSDMADVQKWYLDGGPGSGNWGHESVEGSVGGSAPGGGAQNRQVTEEANFESLEDVAQKAKGYLDTANALIISSQKGNALEQLRHSNIEYNAVKRWEDSAFTDLMRSQREAKIIAYVGEPDKTNGSCVSVALAYIANKAGLKVKDFRGGTSKEYFSMNLKHIGELDGVSMKKLRSTNSLKDAHDLLDGMIPGRQYCLGAGKHAAIVMKRANGDNCYLELQGKRNSWKKLDDRTLQKRFKCQERTLNKVSKTEMAKDSVLIDVETLASNKDFRQLVGYINTERE